MADHLRLIVEPFHSKVWVGVHVIPDMRVIYDFVRSFLTTIRKWHKL